MKLFKVKKSGALTLLQDGGRFGYLSYGMTNGGVMDEQAAGWANKLLQNSPQAPLLEITLGGLVMEARQSIVIALTGADCHAKRNGEPLDNWSSHRLYQGDILTFGWAKTGQRAYLSVVGGFKVDQVLGSVSTVVRESVGGLNGEAISTGDVLSCYRDHHAVSHLASVPPTYRPNYEQTFLTLRLIAGYQLPDPSEQLGALIESVRWRISSASDRMGIRLEGENLQRLLKLDAIPSEGIVYGSVQLPPDGQPIILMKERQTLGGYPKLGAILPLDCFLLSQCRAGTEVRFELISIEAAQNIMSDFYQFFSPPWKR